MRVITFLRVGFPLAQISFLSVPVAADLGVGSAGRSSVRSILILKRVIRIRMLRNRTMPSAVKRRRDSNRRTTAQVDIIAIVRSGGPSGLNRKCNRLRNI